MMVATSGTPATFVEYAASRDPVLRGQLVEQHLGLAYQLARRFGNRGEPQDDLIQVASLALINAVDRFEPARGFEFSTFATRTVLGELKRHFRDKGWAVRAPRRIQELYLELGVAAEELTHELGHPPTVSELAVRTGAAQDAVLEALEAGQGYRTASIDAPDRTEGTIGSHLGKVDAGYEGTEDHQVLIDALGTLPERERTIVKLRFVDGMSQAEIASEVGVSQMHVSRLLSDSLAKLRASFSTNN